ncbi:putative E3 ubiquitin-protein ligase RNF217-like, partial [Trifolium medium]|nr:putative E3 ubiquitin-protein ligase RNF217-like [Trifolium medium]
MGKEETNRFPSLDSFYFSGKQNISDVIDLSDEDDDIKIINFIPNNTYFGTRKRNNNFEKGECSYSKGRRFVCKICLDTKTTRDAFYISGCNHAYCSDCVAKHIRSKLDDNIINIRCPFFLCKSGTLEAGVCRSILPTEDFKRWDKAVCEVLFNIREKFYCPFVDCSALLINDGTEAVKNLECPNCNRMLCGLCKIRSHEGFGCSEFKKLKRDDKGKDVILANIAEDMRWRQCPKCSDYVAKSGGCNIMTC